ncbi:hypothetical protein MMC16_006821 [Acarospora aff. strigata]|nr:hypothetical protein [Acarospora aff. strigata]
MAASRLIELVKDNRPPLETYEELYKHFHSHPELSHQENQIAATAAAYLRSIGFEIHKHIGGHGLVGVLKNGQGKTILLRADTDALPVEEKTELLYASKVTMKDNDGITKPVMHACGHDMHVTCLLAAAELLHRARDSWRGTLIVLFQPAEERGAGAKAMVEDGLYDKIPVPDIVLGAHLMPYRAGTVGTKVGLMASAADSFKITLYGRGGHASQPHRTIDPVVMAAHIVVRLQTIVSREVGPDDAAVVTVGSVQAGMTENIIADKAEIKVNVRTVDKQTRDRVLASMRRIVKAECDASGATQDPTFEPTSMFPFTMNDEEVTRPLEEVFSQAFDPYDRDIARLHGSEDFSILATSQGRPASYWVYGGVDPEKWDAAEKDGRLQEDIPINHSPFFAPVIQPTLRTGMESYALAALRFLYDESHLAVLTKCGRHGV